MRSISNAMVKYDQYRYVLAGDGPDEHDFCCRAAHARRRRHGVGERGVRLSGGQRQRIGIARALYKQADVIIFDEATSALDSETEEAVMQAIDGLSNELTILIIAHRLSTLKNCTQIVEVGELSQQANSPELQTVPASA